MLRFVVKQVLRGFRKNWFYHFSTIVGFGAALLICTLVVSLLLREYSTDSFHKEAIFRISMTSPVGVEREVVTYHELAREIREVAPEVNKVTHTYYPGFIVVSLRGEGEKAEYREKSTLFADSEFLNIFNFPLIRGDRLRCLSNPNSAVLTVGKGKSYFGSTDVIGETFEAFGRTFTVTGVVRKAQENSHLNFDILFSCASLAPASQALQYPGFTYFCLANGADYKEVENKLNRYRSKLLSFKPDRWPVNPFLVEPVRDVYFNPDYPDYLSAVVSSRDRRSLNLFTFLACSILVAATINFLVCHFTKVLFDSKEIAIKKIFGIKARWLLFQFSLEGFLILFISLLLSLVAASLLHVDFYTWAGATADSSMVFSPYTVEVIVVLIIVLSLLLGLATYGGLLIFNADRPLSKRSGYSAGTLKVLNVLLLSQLMCSSSLLIINLIVSQQVDFLYNEPIGYAKDELVEIDLSGLPDDFNSQGLKNAVQTLPQIQSASLCVGGPMTGRWERDITYKDAIANLGWYQADEDFVATLGLDILYGSDFSRRIGMDSSYVLINETAAKFFNIGYNLDSIRSDLPISGSIAGIVKDFHYGSFRSKVGPVFISYRPFHVLGPFKGKLLVRTRNPDQKTIASIKDVWDRITHGAFFEYSFVSADYLTQYVGDKNESRLLKFASVVIFVITCFGVIGISYFLSFKRLREIAIRKVLGASDMLLLSGWLSRLILAVLIAFIIAGPIGIFVTKSWMEGFAYKARFSVGPVFLAFVVVSAALMLSASYNLWRAVRRKPVDVLKYE